MVNSELRKWENSDGMLKKLVERLFGADLAVSVLAPERRFLKAN